MGNYSLDQAQRDIANTRFLIQALANAGAFTNLSATGTVTFPDGSTWTVSGVSLAAPLPLAQGGTGFVAASNAALLTHIGAAPLASPTFTGTVTFPDGSTINVTQLALANSFNVPSVAAPSTPGSGAQVYAASGQLKYVSTDGNAYSTGKKLLQGNPNTNLGASNTNISGASTPVVAGAYRFRASLGCSTSVGTAGGAVNMGWTGPSASTAWMTGTSIGGNIGFGKQSAALFSATFGSIASGATYIVSLEGYAVFTASGTLQLIGTSGTTVTYTVNTFGMEVYPA
jgi:hypothetical protein